MDAQQPQQQPQQTQNAAINPVPSPPPPHVSPKGIWTTKIVFRVLAALSSIVIIGITADMSKGWMTGWSYGYFYSHTSPVVLFAPPAAVAFVWDVVEGICIGVRRGHRGIHPGAIVGIDLVLWCTFVFSTVWFGLLHYWELDDLTWHYTYDEIPSELKDMMVLGQVVLAFGCILVVVHFILFVFGCRETSIRNRKAPIIMYAGTPHPYSQFYGHPQPIMLPAGQAPPAGYVAWAYGPEVNDQTKVEQQNPEPTSQLPQRPAPVQGSDPQASQA